MNKRVSIVNKGMSLVCHNSLCCDWLGLKVTLSQGGL